MTDGVGPEVRCPNCGGNEITTDKRYGAKLESRDLVRWVLRTPIFWIGIVLVGVGLFYPGFQWRAALAVLGIVLMMNAILNNEKTVVDGSDASRYPWASHTCQQCGYQWISEKTHWAVLLSSRGKGYRTCEPNSLLRSSSCWRLFCQHHPRTPAALSAFATKRTCGRRWPAAAR